MAYALDNHGLGFLGEDIKDLKHYAVKNGTAIKGYYGLPYFNLHLGEAQLIVRTKPYEKNLQATGIDTHSVNSCVWRVLVKEELDYENAEVTQKRCLVKRADTNEGMAVVNIVNADVLPSLAPGEEIHLQMTAYSVQFHYHTDEEDYFASCPQNQASEAKGLEDGTILPYGLLANKSRKERGQKQDSQLDSYVEIRAKVKELRKGFTQLEVERRVSFVHCILDTQFGDLDFVHTFDQIPLEERVNFREGAVVSGSFVLSGDAAIYEYEHGAVMDQKNHLKLLRYIFLGGDVERLRGVLAPGAVYESQTNGKTFCGHDAIIDRIRLVQQNRKGTYAVFHGAISKCGKLKKHYPLDTPCLALFRLDPVRQEGLAFVDMDDKGRISRIFVTADEQYRCELHDIPAPKQQVGDRIITRKRNKAGLPFSKKVSIGRLMIARARHLDILPKTWMDEQELEESFGESGMFHEIAEENVRRISCLPFEARYIELEKLFGRLFQKTLEEEFPVVTTGIRQAIDVSENLGMNLFLDFCALHPVGEGQNETWYEDLRIALTAVQVLAVQFAGRIAEQECIRC